MNQHEVCAGKYDLTMRFYRFHDIIRGLAKSGDEARLQVACFLLIGGEV